LAIHIYTIIGGGAVESTAFQIEYYPDIGVNQKQTTWSDRCKCKCNCKCIASWKYFAV